MSQNNKKRGSEDDPPSAPEAPSQPAIPRVLVLKGEITYDTVGEFAEALAFLNAQSDEPIEVRIISPGGRLLCGLALYDLILTNPRPVVTLGYGLVGSSAAIVFLAGHFRFLAPNARLMIHKARIGIEAELTAEESSTVRSGILDEDKKIEKLMSQRTGKPVSRIAAWCKEEASFDAKAAVENGFADGIIGIPVVRTAVRKGRNKARKRPSRSR